MDLSQRVMTWWRRGTLSEFAGPRNQFTSRQQVWAAEPDRQIALSRSEAM